MLVLQIIWAAISGACFIAFGMYMFLAWRGDSPILYSLAFGEHRYSPKEKLFLGFAAVGLLVCIFNGAEAMLYWVPDRWGSFDEDGDFHKTRVMLAALYVGGAIAWIEFLSTASYKVESLDRVGAEARGLSAILESQDSKYELEALKSRFERSLCELVESREQAGRTVQKKGPVYPQDIKAEMYRPLIDAVVLQQQKLSDRVGVSKQQPST